MLLPPGRTETLSFSIHGTGYYMVYGSASFQNWTTLGIAPKAIVNANMNRLQHTTMAVMTGIVGILAVTILLLVVQNNRQKLRKKDQQLLAREELFLESFSQCGRCVPDDRHRNRQGGIRQVPMSSAFWAFPPKQCKRISTVLCAAGGDDCASRLEKADADGAGRSAGVGSRLYPSGNGRARYIHVIGFINDVQGAKVHRGSV